MSESNGATRCFFCSAEMAPECPNCLSGHVRFGVLEFLWNGFLAKRVDLAWCHSCDLVWLVGADGHRIHICPECRERLLAVEVQPVEPAAAAIAAA